MSTSTRNLQRTLQEISPTFDNNGTWRAAHAIYLSYGRKFYYMPHVIWNEDLEEIQNLMDEIRARVCPLQMGWTRSWLEYRN